VTHGGYARYLVLGTRLYRGHPPGTTFEAKLDPAAEQRAIERGAIKVLTRVEPSLDTESYQLPPDWPPSEADAPAHPEAPKGASFVGEGG
jgi:hypothetical protein